MNAPQPVSSGRDQAGFTLIELLVAVFIVLVMVGFAYGGLEAVLRSNDTIQRSNEATRELQMTLFRVAQDLEQARDRGIRDQFGDIAPSLIYSEENPLGPLLEFTRGGRRNPLDREISALQRMGYALIDDELRRLTWARLDRAQDAEANQTVLMSKVVDLRWRFMDAAGQWQERWPPIDPTTATANLDAGLPQVIEMQVETEQWGLVRGLYRVSGAAQPSGQAGQFGQGGRT